MNRRTFLEALAATVAAAGCSRAPDQRLQPYVRQPELMPGRPQRYATSIVEGGYATGLVVESHEGRPTKVEGNPAHPASLGATSAAQQAWVLSLYDPSRVRAVSHVGAPSTEREAIAAIAAIAAKDVRVLLPASSSPLLAERLTALRARRPNVRVWFHDGPNEAWEGARRAFGQVLEDTIDLERCDLFVDVDADSLSQGPRQLVYARAFGKRRRLRTPNDPPLRVWTVEPALTCTGAASDRRTKRKSSEIVAFLAGLLAEITPGKLPTPIADGERSELARELLAHRGRAAIALGAEQPPEAHVLVHALNVAFGAPITRRPSPVLEAGNHDLASFDGGGDALFVLGGNPAYSIPGDFAAKLRGARERFVLSSHDDETARVATWLIPSLHGLERWGNARAADGTVSSIQPLISPLFGGLDELSILSALLGEPFDAHAAMSVDDATLQRGFVEGSAYSPVEPRLDDAAVLAAAHAAPPLALEIRTPRDATLGDGEWSNVGWLQELPDPITQLTWGNAARLSPATAKRFDVTTGDEIEIEAQGAKVRAPVLVVPGDADDVLTLTRGYGRVDSLPIAASRGVDARPLRRLGAPFVSGSFHRTGRKHALAIAQQHAAEEDRPHVRSVGLEEWKPFPEVTPKPTLYKLPLAGSPLGNQWGMVVDLAACTGCSACVVACQAENNVPTVGPVGVRLGREMHWLRIDRYWQDDHVLMQPMLCQHCEKAPCEYVCPVNATAHSPDGLNEMVYNRCVGTRFCSANCPYKVRRFNWFRYEHPATLVLNPNVTVRERGVMEKCTFCVQRIREGEIAARRESRALRDGEIVTACAQACPTGALVFGSIADPRSAVSEARKIPRGYAVLDELGTEPRVRYLARVVVGPKKGAP